jgi:hypothetical protein
MGCLFRLLLLLIFVGLPAGAVFYGIDRAPLASGGGAIGPAQLRQAALIGVRLAAAPPGVSGAGVTLNASEIDLLVRAWASRAPNVDARAAVSRFGVSIGATAALPLPENPIGRYVNLRATIAPSRTGLAVDRLAIGRIEVPQMLIRPIVMFALDQFGGAGQGEAIYGAVKSVAVSGERVTIGLSLSPEALVGAASGMMGGALPSTGNARIDTMIRNASPEDRQRVMRAIQEGMGGDAAAQSRAMEALRQRFGGSLPAGSEQMLRDLQQQYGGSLPSDPEKAMDEIKRRYGNDPAARERALRELQRRQ